MSPETSSATDAEASPGPAGAEDSGRPTFSVIGAGRVGVTLGVLLRRKGYRIVAASARSSESRDRAVAWLRCLVTEDPVQAAKAAECTLLCVADDAIAGVCEKVAAAGAFDEGSYVIHTAGSLGVAPLAAASGVGARVLAIHPLQSVPDIETGIERIPGSWFGVTCDESSIGWAETFVADLGGKMLTVPEDARPLYHLAAVFASNFLVTLASAVEGSWGSVEPFLPLMKGTLANLENLGPREALTGPVVRGDAGTLRRHIETLNLRSPELAAAYKALARVTLVLAISSGRIGEVAAESVGEVLGRSSE